MSVVASQIILHPTITQSIKVLGTTIGRDKAYRAIQYFSRFLAWFLLRRGSSLEASRWDAMNKAMASCRKVIRLGKPMEHLQAALRATHVRAPTAEQITLIGRQLGYAGFLSYDAIAWASSIKFIRLDPARTQAYAKLSWRFWLTGILFSITHGLLKAGRLANEAKALRSGRTSEKETIGSESQRAALVEQVHRQRQTVRSQMLLDVLDVWIPASNLGLVALNDGVIGVVGFTTSMLALNTQWASAAAAAK